MRDWNNRNLVPKRDPHWNTEETVYCVFARMGVGYDWYSLGNTNSKEWAEETKQRALNTWRIVEIRETTK